MQVLTLQCEDQSGIVASVSSALHQSGLNIEESAQFHDKGSNTFFMRVLYSGDSAEFTTSFEKIAEQFGMNWQIRDKDQKIKTVILCSKEYHCLNDLIYRVKSGGLNLDIVGVISNHKECQADVEKRGLRFHYLPVTPENKKTQEQEIVSIIKETGADLVVLARYMQILSADYIKDFGHKTINIHHSFLPGFKGAKPYSQAYERGVKMIGSTAHFATDDLDEGPIICQDVVPVTHSDLPQQLKKKGMGIENLVLSRAVELFSEHRLFLNGNRTIVL